MRYDDVNKKSPTIILLVGIPGVGKSSWLENFPELNKFTIISSDAEVERLVAELGLTYTTGFQKVIGQATSIWKQKLKNAIANRENIIVDMTNLTAKKRRGILNQAKGYRAEAVVWNLTDKEWARRFNKRKAEVGKDIPPEVIKNMNRSFTMPTKAEGFEKITVIRN